MKSSKLILVKTYGEVLHTSVTLSVVNQDVLISTPLRCLLHNEIKLH